MAQSDPATFGQLLRQHRLDAGLTQEALAERAGLSARGVQSLELGVRHPHRETVDLLVKALRIGGEARARFVAAGQPSPHHAPASFRGAAAVSRPSTGVPRPSWPFDDDQHGPASPAAAHPTNLPVQLSSFVGRRREITEVQRLLQTNRLITLTGTGGCGKTRLALRVASELLPQYRDGVRLAALAPISDPALVPQVVASAVGIRKEPGQPTTAILLARLRNRRLLLVLDNCEHLADASARLVDELLHGCPQLQVLATSREALGIDGELPWRVPSLSFPDPRELLTAQSLGQYEAVQLFVERAATVQPGFALTEEHAPVVAQVCSRLDGIPLALELAAARLKALTVEQVARRLDDQFRLLTGGSRTALPRHQTLRATIDWSYDLLSPDEKVLFGRLSVFLGGWTLEAAEAICAGGSGGRGRGPGDCGMPAPVPRPPPPDPRPLPPTLAPADVLDLLTTLVDKSLVQVDTKGDEARYSLLEAIRQYAQERLAESGETARIRDRHRDWHAAQVRRAGADPDTFDAQGRWPRWLTAEKENLRAALEWSLDRDPEVALTLAGGAEDWAWVERLLPKAPARTVLRAQALFFVANDHHGRGDYALAWPRFEEALAACREAPWPYGIAWTLECMGLLAHQLGDDRRALELYEESLAAYRHVGSEFKAGWVLLWLSMTHSRNGDLPQARAVLEESLAIFRRTGDEFSIAATLHELGVVALAEGDLARARQRVEESIDYARQSWRGSVEVALTTLACLARLEGDHARAGPLLEEALIIFRRDGFAGDLRQSLTQLAALARREGQLERADALLAEALGAQQDQPWDRLGRASVLAGQALVAQARGEPGKVSALHDEILGIARESTSRYDRAVCLYVAATAAVGAVGRCARLAGSASTVLGELGLAAVLTTQLRGYPDIHCEVAEALDTARATLGHEAFARSWAEGRAMTLEQAIEYALVESADASPA